MELFSQAAKTRRADKLVEGDMILTGDKLLGIAAFCEVDSVEQKQGFVYVRVSTGRVFVMPVHEEVILV